MNKLWLVLILVVLANAAVLGSCCYKPPSKPWKEVINRNLPIKELGCVPSIPSPADAHCHLEVVDSVPTRYLRVSKPWFGDYRVSIVTPGADKSDQTETGMTCTNLKEPPNAEKPEEPSDPYRLTGSCKMDGGDQKGDSSDEHPAHAFNARVTREGGTGKWIVYFDFRHGIANIQHNGNGHTE